MGMNTRPWRVAAAAAVLLAGCAGAPQQYAVKEVYVCAAEECGTAGHKYSSGQMLAAFQQLIKVNAGESVSICASDPQTRSCESIGMCHFVQGGPFPGSGCGNSLTFRSVALDSQAGQVRVKANMARTFLGVSLACADMAATISVRSADEITYEAEPHYCNWLGVGNMTATFNIAVESVDLDRGQIGGYWNHAVAGTGNGSGSGYAVLKFPKSMPRGENWIAVP